MVDIRRLPTTCATLHPVTGKPIMLKAGVKGYWPAPDIDPDTYNRAMNVTNAELKAMEVGALFGFDVPGANPDYHLCLNCKGNDAERFEPMNLEDMT
jgi:hypothetical protein